MKKEIIQRILMILVVLAVGVYTVLNYRSGKTDFEVFAVSAALLLYFLVSNVRQLFSIWRNS